MCFRFSREQLNWFYFLTFLNCHRSNPLPHKLVIVWKIFFQASRSIANKRYYIGLAKPKSGGHFSFPTQLVPARTRTRVVRLGAQCTDHWTTEQSRGVGVPPVQLTTYVKSSTLHGHRVVRSYIQIFSA